MKKTILLITSVVAGTLLFSSYSNGPAAMGQNNRTGSNGGPTCAAGGCHASQTANTTASFGSIVNASTNQPITGNKYVPGQTYHVSFTGDHPSFTHWGFQTIALNGTTEAGTASATMTGTHVPSGFTTLVEHGMVLSQTNSAFEGTFDWTAPASGGGPVKFFGIINAVNFDGGSGGDAPSMTFESATLTEQTTGIDEPTSAQFEAYPNPTMGDISLKLPSVNSAYTVKCYDMSGRECFAASTSAAELQLPSSRWATGSYFIHVMFKNGSKVIPVTKH